MTVKIIAPGKAIIVYSGAAEALAARCPRRWRRWCWDHFPDTGPDGKVYREGFLPRGGK